MTFSSPMRICEMPHSERPRERLRDLGPDALSTSELLSILIGSGTPRHSALALAHELLARNDGSLRRLATQPIAKLTTLDGLGEARAVAIMAALELGRRMIGEGKATGTQFLNPEDVYLSFGPRLEGLAVEEFHIGILDAQHRLDRDVLITRGILNSSLAHPREVFREAIAERASAIVLVHNHPSGDPTPSYEDRVVTWQLWQAGNLLDIPVRDHIIVGVGRFVSFSRSGFLDKPPPPRPPHP